MRRGPSPLRYPRGPVRAGHAAVTVAVHHRRMLKAAWRREPRRTGVLIVRVWAEGESGSPQLRVRMIGRQDLDRNAHDTASASTVQEALAYVRRWLEQFNDSA